MSGATPAALRSLGLSSDPVAAQAAPSLKRRADESALALRERAAQQSVLSFKRQRVEEAVLPELDYTSALSHIIERDFYPDLPRLQQQLRYLEAIESGDQQRIAQIEAEVAASLQMEALERQGPPPRPPPQPQQQLGNGNGKNQRPSSSASSSAFEENKKGGRKAAVATAAAFSDATPRLGSGDGGGGGGGIVDEDDDAASVASWSAGIAGPAAAGRAAAASSPHHSVDSRRLEDFEDEAQHHNHQQNGGGGADDDKDDDSHSVYSSASSTRLNPSQRAAKSSTRMGLNAFMLRYTGEDNASFAKNLRQFEEARARRHWWLHQQVDGRAKLKLLRDGSAKALLPHEARKELFITDGSAESTLGKKPYPNTWVHRPKNALFFGPDLASSYATSGVTNWSYNPDLRLPMAAIADAPSSSSSSSSSSLSVLADGAPRLLLTDQGTTIVPLTFDERQKEEKERQQGEKRMANLALLDYHLQRQKQEMKLLLQGEEPLRQLILRDDQALSMVKRGDANNAEASLPVGHGAMRAVGLVGGAEGSAFEGEGSTAIMATDGLERQQIVSASSSFQGSLILAPSSASASTSTSDGKQRNGEGRRFTPAAASVAVVSVKPADNSSGSGSSGNDKATSSVVISYQLQSTALISNSSSSVSSSSSAAPRPGVVLDLIVPSFTTKPGGAKARWTSAAPFGHGTASVPAKQKELRHAATRIGGLSSSSSSSSSASATANGSNDGRQNQYDRLLALMTTNPAGGEESDDASLAAVPRVVLDAAAKAGGAAGATPRVNGYSFVYSPVASAGPLEGPVNGGASALLSAPDSLYVPLPQSRSQSQSTASSVAGGKKDDRQHLEKALQVSKKLGDLQNQTAMKQAREEKIREAVREYLMAPAVLSLDSAPNGASSSSSSSSEAQAQGANARSFRVSAPRAREETADMLLEQAAAKKRKMAPASSSSSSLALANTGPLTQATPLLSSSALSSTPGGIGAAALAAAAASPALTSARLLLGGSAATPALSVRSVAGAGASSRSMVGGHHGVSSSSSSSSSSSRVGLSDAAKRIVKQVAREHRRELLHGQGGAVGAGGNSSISGALTSGMFAATTGSGSGAADLRRSYNGK